MPSEYNIDFEMEYDRLFIPDPNSHEEDIEIEIAYYHRLIQDSLEVRRLPNGHILVGYLCQDTDCASPEEPDGFGRIGTASLRDSRELNRIYQTALGLDSEWVPLLTRDSLLEELAYALDRDSEALLRDPSQEASRENLKLPYRGKWDALLAQHLHDGDLRDPDAIMLSVYEHGGRVYSVSDGREFPDFEWDVASGGAVWVPDDSLREECAGLNKRARRQRMFKFASQAVQEMNQWLNGACYGVVTQEHDARGLPFEHVIGYTGRPGEVVEVRDYEDACWGFIGEDYATQELQSWMDDETQAAVKQCQLESEAK